MHILCTGGEGFIGTHLVQELRKHGHTVKVWDRASNPDHELRIPGALETYLDTYPSDAVIHLAAKVGRLFGEDNIRQTIDDNAGLTALVAQVCGDRGIRLVYASTSEVYGDIGNKVAVEDVLRFSDAEMAAAREDITSLRIPPLAKVGEKTPHNAYGLSKRQGEEYCELYAPKDLTIWRISMPYGPGLPAGIGRAAIINFLYNALHGLPIQVHRDSERSWCWIGDTVTAMRLTLSEPGGVWNIGRDDNPTSMLDVAKIACALTGGSYDLIEEIDPPARQTVVKRLSTAKIRSIGWEPRVELVAGMERTLAAVRAMAPPEAIAA